jgi:hypothetical protein
MVVDTLVGRTSGKNDTDRYELNRSIQASRRSGLPIQDGSRTAGKSRSVRPVVDGLPVALTAGGPTWLDGVRHVAGGVVVDVRLDDGGRRRHYSRHGRGQPDRGVVGGVSLAHILVRALAGGQRSRLDYGRLVCSVRARVTVGVGGVFAGQDLRGAPW